MSKIVHRYKNIFIVGLPGVGKTHFGRSYAAHTARTFCDLDRVIEFEQGRSIPQIFEREGEQEFREIERHTLQKLARRQNIVLSLGGGAFCNEVAVRLLSEHGLIVCLQDDPARLATRLFEEKSQRPLFSAVDSVEGAFKRLSELIAQREGWYGKAHLNLDLRFSSIDAAKIELSTFEERAFSKVYRHELEKLGERIPQAPDIEVHRRPRYVLQERPYLAIFSDKTSGRVAQRTGSKKKGAPGKKGSVQKSSKGQRPHIPDQSPPVAGDAENLPKRPRKNRSKGKPQDSSRSPRRPEAQAPMKPKDGLGES